MTKLSDLAARWKEDPEFREAYALVVEIERLQQECAEAYQVVGALADMAGVFERPEVGKVLDNLCAAAGGEPRPHADVLPFVVEGVQPIGTK